MDYTPRQIICNFNTMKHFTIKKKPLEMNNVGMCHNNMHIDVALPCTWDNTIKIRTLQENKNIYVFKAIQNSNHY